MADDIASLGISVDSSQATKAAGELDKLAASSKNAAQASNDLANASTISANQQRYYETIARKTGETVDQVATRYKASADALKAQAGAAGQAEAAHVTLAKSLGSTVLASTGLGMSLNASRAALSLLATPLMATVTGVAALGAGAVYASESWKDGQRDIERALVGIGARSGATVDDINKFASASASVTGLSITSARDAAIEFIKTGAIYKENIGQAVSLTDAFSKAMGLDAAEGAKALGKALADPLKGAQELDKEFGFLNASTLGTIRNLVSQNDAQGAQRVLLDAITPKIQQAAKLTSGWADAWTAVKNTSSAAFNSVGSALSPDTKQGQLERIQKTGAPIGIGGVEFGGADLAAAQMAQLQKSIDAASDAAASAKFGKLSLDADAVTRSVIPEIAKIEELQGALSKLNALKDAQSSAGISNLPETESATRAIEVQLNLLKEQTAETDRHNAKVLEIAGSYQGISTQTALILEKQQQQLAVASAITGEGRLAAQEAATRADLELRGVDATEAAAIAAGQREIAETQITAHVQSQVLAMQDQLSVAGAVTGAERMRAESAATYNALVREGVDSMTAAIASTTQMEIAQARVNSQIENQVFGIKQQTELLRARANGSEASVASSQAYTNAIRAGASETEAAALQAAVLANNVAKADGSARSFSASMKGGYASLNQWGNQTVGMPGTSGTPLQQAMWEAQYGQGGFSTYINGGFGPAGGRFDVFATPNDQGKEFAASQQLQAAALKNMDAVTAAKFKAGSFKLPASDAQGLANSFLQQGSNATDVNAQKAAASFVSQYGDSASSTSTSLTSPLYMSSSGSTNLGFRAAEGMDYTVPGSGPVDSVKVSGMVSPGERMIMIPPGGAAPRDMQGGSTQSRPAIQQTINISAPSMQGASDTMSQLAARASRAAYAASRHR